jgi:hypothetical protein
MRSRVKEAVDFCQRGLILHFGTNGLDIHSDVLLNGGHVNLVVVLMRPDKANVNDARRIIDRHH